MKLEYLKKLLESKTYNGESVIFNTYTNCEFLIHQYIHDIITKHGYEYMFVEEVMDIPVEVNNFLNVGNDKYLYVCYTDNDKELRRIQNLKSTILVYTGKKLKDFEDIEDYVVDIPKLNDNQIKDYVYSRGVGINSKNLDYLIQITNGDLYRLEKELDRLELFEEQIRNSVFEKFVSDNVFGDLENYNSFNLIEAIMKRQSQKALKIFQELKDKGVNDMGLLTLLYNNVRNVIKIQLSPNPTPENTGLNSNQFWAIKKNTVGYYSKDDLLYIFGLLTDMDRKIKTGEIPTDKSFEYILSKILR